QAEDGIRDFHVTGVQTCALPIFFKYFDKFKVHTFQAITVNYIVAATLGFLMTSTTLHPYQIIAKPWALSALILGSSFIGVFYLKIGRASCRERVLTAVAAATRRG